MVLVLHKCRITSSWLACLFSPLCAPYPQILQINRNKSVFHLVVAVMGGDALVEVAHCQQNIYNTPTSVMPQFTTTVKHRGVPTLMAYLVSSKKKLRENPVLCSYQPIVPIYRPETWGLWRRDQRNLHLATNPPHQTVHLRVLLNRSSHTTTSLFT